ncbi:MAG: intradiol ring-cleavage dioxygenase [Thermodesulfobacteriota bacterium]
MHNDDRQVGRVLSRREVIALLGGAAASMLVGCPGEQSSSTPVTETGTPSCVVRPEQTEGPFFVDEHLNRSDIRPDPSDGSVKQGVLLQLVLRVSRFASNGCSPLLGANVDIWHCDALGAYSDFSFEGTAGKKFLRGYQVTDANGSVRFTTIYPGWYPGRTVHIHFKVRTGSASVRSYEFTSQLYFDDSITDEVHTKEPYASRGQRTLRNAQDGIYRAGGNQLMLLLKKAGQGYEATFDIGLQIA